jgi:superkiller protein 3
VAYKYDFAEAHNNLGVANRELGQINNAAKSFKKAIEINPNYILALLNLGGILTDLGDKNEAIECFEKVIAIESENSQARLSLKELSAD